MKKQPTTFIIGLLTLALLLVSGLSKTLHAQSPVAHRGSVIDLALLTGEGLEQMEYQLNADLVYVESSNCDYAYEVQAIFGAQQPVQVKGMRVLGRNDGYRVDLVLADGQTGYLVVHDVLELSEMLVPYNQPPLSATL